jgi:hypothetical protein
MPVLQIAPIIDQANDRSINEGGPLSIVINQRKESSSQGNNLNHNIDDRFVSQESDSLVYAQIM